MEKLKNSNIAIVLFFFCDKVDVKLLTVRYCSLFAYPPNLMSLVTRLIVFSATNCSGVMYCKYHSQFVP